MSTKLEWETFTNTINGQAATTSQTRNGIDPSTETPLPPVPLSTQADVDAAIKAAAAAAVPWSKLSWDERQAYLDKLATAIGENSQGFVDMLVKESGKPVQTAQIEAGMTVDFMRALIRLRVPEEEVDVRPGAKVVLRYNSLGVGCGIVPWNWPLLLGIFQVASALISGNTLILKPSPFTPYTALKLGELARPILPPGVLSVLSGGDDLGPMLTAHPGIDKVTFTGSSATGKKVMASCAATLKRVTLELGGNDAAIICEDADLPSAVGKVGTLCFLSSGQICMDVKRVYVHEDIYDAFKAALLDFARKIKTGPANDPEVLVGPIQNAMQYDKVRKMYDLIQSEKWDVALGGGDLKDQFGKGYFMQPTIIDNPPEDSAIVQEEPFGPIVPILKWKSDDEVIARANASPMGLGGSVWTKDVARGRRMAEQLQVGSAWVNSHFDLSPNVPYGGAKWSGLHRSLGVDGIKSWLEPQSLWIVDPGA